MVEVFESITTKELSVQKLDGAGSSIIMNDNLNLANTKNLVFGSASGSKIGTSATQKLAFYGDTPIVQEGAIGDPASDTASNNAAIDSILATLRAYGLIET